MLIACWSVKGGSGTTVVSIGLALLLARRSGDGALLADLAGDVPAALGVAPATGPGLVDWVGAGAAVGADALERLEITAAPGLLVLPRGSGPWTAADGGPTDERLAAGLRGGLPANLDGGRPVVADCGLLFADHRDDAADPRPGLAASAHVSLLVIRPCFLALRRAVDAPLRPSGVVLVEEPGRALRASDVEDALGVGVRAVIPWDAEVARAVDAGLLASRLPRPLARGLRAAA